jgi:acyl carrier protein
MSGEDDVLPKVSALFREKLELEVPSPETDLLEAGLMDSLTFVELLVQLEQDFGITVSLENLDVENVRSLTRIAEFVRSQRQIESGTSTSGFQG